jgi:hypothetical protein
VNPGAEEIPGNAIDEDCDGVAEDIDSLTYAEDVAPLYDQDGDGFLADDIPSNVLDAVLNGTIQDVPSDVYNHAEAGDLDCDDTHGDTHPGAPQLLTMGRDTNCDESLEVDPETDAQEVTKFYSAVGDINDDGDNEVVVQWYGSDNLYVYSADAATWGAANPDPSTTSPLFMIYGNNIGGPIIKDLNLDGQSDLVFSAGYPYEDNATVFVPGPITGDMEISEELLVDDEALKARDMSVLTRGDQMQLVPDMDGVDVAYGELLLDGGTKSVVSARVLAEPGLHDFVETPSLYFIGSVFYSFVTDAISAASDVNGDGYADLLISSANDNYAMLVFGGTHLRDYTNTEDVIELTPEWDIPGGHHDDSVATHVSATSIPYTVFEGNEETSGDLTGTALASGDLDGDGADDILIGVSGENYESWENAGCVYAMFGGTIEPYQTIDLDGGVFAIGGVKLYGEEDMWLPSYGMAAADVNGDGLADLALGTVYGVASLFMGGSTFYRAKGQGASDSTLSVSLAEHKGYGEDGSQYGRQILSLGDLDGDGFNDVLVHAPEIDAGYVFFGGAAE